MAGVRKYLSPIALFWVVLQIAGAAAPFTLLTAVADACTCPGADHGATCPMHHPQGSQSNQGQQCRLQNAGAPIDVALLAFAGGAGVLARTTGLVQPDLSTARISVATSDRLSHPYAPDSPPPRA